MKCLKRNQIEFYYAPFTGKRELIDEYGNHTGEYEISHGTPQKYAASISAAQGETETLQFGGNLNYDKIIVMDNSAPNIDEYSILWVDVKPIPNLSGKIPPHDYIVKKVARSLNSVAIAISKVNVSE